LRNAFLIGAALRLVAVVFSLGYGMHDDHFVIEDGPWTWFEANHGGWFDRETPPGHSVVYPSILYAIMWVCGALGITDPQSQMFVMRLLHAAFSLVAIPFIWKIANRYGGERSANLAALLYAVFWPMPFMSVRNLIEVVSIPPLIVGWWYAVRDQKRSDLTIAGIAFAFAFCFRYHTALIPLSIVGVMLTTGKVKGAMVLAISFALAILCTQGVADVLAWGTPLAGPIQYISNFFTEESVYVVSPWYTYIVLCLGVFIVPTSIVALICVFTIRDRNVLLYLIIPTVVFIAAHSLIENKQERFILPIVPMLVVIGSLAWTKGREHKPAWLHDRWFKYSTIWFFALNSLLVALFCVSYSKRSRVESMSVLREMHNVQRAVVVADAKVYVPRFYAGREKRIDRIVNDTTDASWELASQEHYQAVVFFGEKSLQQGKKRFEQLNKCRLQVAAVVEPGLLDKILHMLNPRGNKNETSVIYRCIVD